MANLTAEEARQTSSDDLLSIIVSGKNPDGTNWSMPITTQASSTDAAPPTSASVGVSSSLVVAENVNRRGLVLTSALTNTGQIALSMKNSQAAELNKGQILYPGDSFTMDAMTYTNDEIRAISDVAAQTLAIQELT